ncbi:MAG: pyruvate ferredoxin oxidoreductase, partial [Candidatus Altarchaeaceae archaeon]
ENAEFAIVSIGSICGSIKDVIDEEKDVGLIRIRSLRPFPYEDLKESLKNIKGVAVIEKDISVGLGGCLWSEIGLLYKSENLYSCIVGLGGRDVRKEEIKKIVKNLKENKLERINWIGTMI